MTPELLEATECLMVLQKRKGEEARATTAAATTTAAAAETTVAQGEATEAPQQSDQDLEEDDGWQLLMDSLALDD
jgi:glucose dehydrogenase